MANKNIKELFKSFTPEDKEKIFDNILAEKELDKGEEKSLALIKHFRPSLLTAAVLIFVLSTVSFAAVYLDLDTKFLNFLKPSNIDQVEHLTDGAYIVDKQIKNKNGKMDIKQVIGDENTTYILMDFIAPEGTVLNKKHYSFEDIDIDAGQSFYSYRIITLDDEDIEDNKISMIMAINTKESLEGQKAKLKFINLKGLDTISGGFTTSIPGEWKARFNLDFKNYSTNYKIDKDINIHDYNANLKTISVSPISVTLKLKSSFTKEISEATGRWEKLGSDEYPITINYKDGTSETTSIFNGMHNLSHLKGEMIFIKTFESVINDKEIKSITFYNTEIEINN